MGTLILLFQRADLLLHTCKLVLYGHSLPGYSLAQQPCVSRPDCSWPWPRPRPRLSWPRATALLSVPPRSVPRPSLPMMVLHPPAAALDLPTRLVPLCLLILVTPTFVPVPRSSPCLTAALQFC